ncbi:FCD domain-containing protein [Xinfangfangia sp. D13-10-4-6]|uniref:GntR family transcriptional regulator n=1 Tax=Pseudogemmobacter hezensis TaxID=2737662 RepID=UPI0015577D16|nr:FCD domain-containing protein [Pseudogemmobacter hezensis]NPD16336.1 FCD domain-containing protein [Pseudogemmobacter hezensis]
MTSASPARSLSDRTYLQLREDIVAGKLQAGAKLKLEGLMQDYGVGMSPLREALARLIGDRMVTTEAQRGFWVAPMSLAELDDLTRVRSLLETEAISSAIVKGDAAWMQSVTDTFSQLADIEAQLPASAEALTPQLLEAWESSNRAFHASLVAAADSPIIIRFRQQLYQQSERYRRVSLTASRGWRSVTEEHLAIYEAVRDRNVLRACKMTEIHLTRTADEVRKAFAAANPERFLAAT